MTTDFSCSTKATPVINMAPNTTADMVNADCVHNRRLDALCPILVLFEYTVDRFTNERQSIYDQVIKFKEYGVSVSKASNAQHLSEKT